MVEGGWWEGILNDRVGWFPGNHVEEISHGNSKHVLSHFINNVLQQRAVFGDQRHQLTAIEIAYKDTMILL